MANVEQEIVAEGAQILWVLEQDTRREPGTAEACRAVMDYHGSREGWCVGDAQTSPVPGTFDASPFSVERGFDILVPRATMEVVYSTSHGTPAGNENPSGEEVLEVVREVAAQLGR